MTYYHKTPIGTFSIKPTGDKYRLYLESDPIGNYQTALKASTFVSSKMDGCKEWACLEDVELPQKLSEWQVVHSYT